MPTNPKTPDEQIQDFVHSTQFEEFRSTISGLIDEIKRGHPWFVHLNGLEVVSGNLLTVVPPPSQESSVESDSDTLPPSPGVQPA